MKEKLIKSIIDLMQTHTEHEGGYCDTGGDMEWRCRSKCMELAIKRLIKSNLISQALDEYADWKIKECLPEKTTRPFTLSKQEELYNEGYEVGWNACIDNILINADIKCKGCKQERCQCGKTHNEPYSGFDAVA